MTQRMYLTGGIPNTLRYTVWTTSVWRKWEINAFFIIENVVTNNYCNEISPGEKMIQAAKNVASTLQPGVGMLLLRDYGRYDEAQLKLGTSRGKRLGDNFYVKHDGTRCYYFTLEDLETLFVQHAQLELVQCNYITRTYTNRSSQGTRNRVWVQARFRKPL